MRADMTAEIQYERTLASGVQDPFHFDPARRIVICKTCQRGLSADKSYFDNHLTKHHGNQFTAVERPPCDS
ncbi:hypothetical protein HRR90_003299 [Exophiala dermatitidis]|nr:hypothetical protein HRR73_001998 [Exophiala dermatitidis]KAJ4532925.1 hypothetical protein HRR76_007899 [Exophiala dermatitidis]KAJ4538806.1 hypothetical protein HRR77_006732 [Exophiala dermatitidis]KAJ4574071.1 hypothetical protein HRR79_003072 [Exophiala dermatitidis]KAJ4577314.1 hypothetical protein HRR81_003768 [Exophiala dermatitidis]